MPDLEDAAVEGEPDLSAEAAQGAAETEAPPWGDDFQPEKAWNTITKQRESEKELKDRLRALEEDDEAFLELARKRGFQVEDTDDDDEDTGADDLFEDDDDPRFQKLTELEKRTQAQDEWIKQQQHEQLVDGFEKVVADASKETDWPDLTQRSKQRIWDEAHADPKGFSREAIERAHKSELEFLDSIATQGVERAKKPKPKAPHVTRGGQAATQTPGWSDMNPEQQAEEMARRLQANAQ